MCRVAQVVYFYLRSGVSQLKAAPPTPVRLSFAAKKVMVVFFLTAVGWIFNLAPSHQIAMGSALILCCLNSMDSKILGKDPMNSVSLSILLLFGGGLALGHAMLKTDAALWLSEMIRMGVLIDIIGVLTTVSFMQIYRWMGWL